MLGRLLLKKFQLSLTRTATRRPILQMKSHCHRSEGDFSLMIRPAHTDELNILSDFAVRSKASWGYDGQFMEQCQEELRVDPQSILSHHCFVATRTATKAQITTAENNSNPITLDIIVGFITLDLKEATRVKVDYELEALFVDPQWMGRGIGRKLLQYALDIMIERNRRLRDQLQDLARKQQRDYEEPILSLWVQSDPSAEPFYRKLGGQRVGQRESASVPGRKLPLLVFYL